jgi:toxin ParE1/3/4
MRKLNEEIRALKDAPNLGRPGRIDGTRELLFPPLPYIAVYSVHEQSVEIWRIFHTSQDRR